MVRCCRTPTRKKDATLLAIEKLQREREFRRKVRHITLFAVILMKMREELCLIVTNWRLGAVVASRLSPQEIWQLRLPCCFVIAVAGAVQTGTRA